MELSPPPVRPTMPAIPRRFKITAAVTGTMLVTYMWACAMIDVYSASF